MKYYLKCKCKNCGSIFDILTDQENFGKVVLATDTGQEVRIQNYLHSCVGEDKKKIIGIGEVISVVCELNNEKQG